MKVLLVSPKDPEPEKITNLRFLMGGENTYTQSLLANPPPGVEYVHYQQAFKQGKIAYTGWQNFLSFLMKVGLFPPDAGFQCLETKDKFDLIHCHAYCLKLKNFTGPVVLSDSSSNFLFLKDYLGWGQKRITAFYALRKFLAQRFAFYDPNLNLKDTPLVVWSNFAKKVHQSLGANSDKVVVIPPGLKKARFKKKKHPGVNILFVGIWFERKGGPLVLKAYKKLKVKYQKLKLTIVGQVPPEIKLPTQACHWNYLLREKLMREVFPKADILVLVPPVAEGYGLVVHEAASYGIPSIVSRVYALPELVEDQKTGFVITPGSLEELVEKLEILVKNHALREKMGKEAKKRFEEKFWIERTNEKLLRVYQEAINKISNF